MIKCCSVGECRPPIAGRERQKPSRQEVRRRTRWKVIIAMSGRRIDAKDAKATRFPLKNVALVKQRLDELFARVAATALVSSGACGADLVALTVAGTRH